MSIVLFNKNFPSLSNQTHLNLSKKLQLLSFGAKIRSYFSQVSEVLKEIFVLFSPNKTCFAQHEVCSLTHSNKTLLTLNEYSIY